MGQSSSTRRDTTINTIFKPSSAPAIQFHRGIPFVAWYFNSKEIFSPTTAQALLSHSQSTRVKLFLFVAAEK
jgi:hypothetical protein